MRYFIDSTFNGKNYHGWQIQPNAISVQEKITNALSTILREAITIVGAGRTDAGVHAQQMVAHFEVSKPLNEVQLTQKVNAFLPNDIVINTIYKVSNKVHARFDAISRSYEYRIWLGRNPFLLDTTYQLYQQNLDLKKMNEAAAILLEYTNFKCFSKSKTNVTTYNCTITKATWVVEGNLVTFYITANRFLRNMVRAIVGTLIEIGLGKKTVQEIRAIIESKDRSQAGVSVPPQGLFLTKVMYDERIFGDK